LSKISVMLRMYGYGLLSSGGWMAWVATAAILKRLILLNLWQPSARPSLLIPGMYLPYLPRTITGWRLWYQPMMGQPWNRSPVGKSFSKQTP